METPLLVTIFFAGATAGIWSTVAANCILGDSRGSRNSEIEALQISVDEWLSELAAIRETLDEIRDDLRKK